MRNERSNKAARIGLGTYRLGHLHFVTNPLLFLFALAFGRPLRIRIMGILHYPGCMHFDRLNLSTLLQLILLGEDLPQQSDPFSLANLGAQRLQPFQQV